MAAILDIGNGKILAIMNLYVDLMPPTKFRLNLTCGLGGDVFVEFQDGHSGSHLGYWNRTIFVP